MSFLAHVFLREFRRAFRCVETIIHIFTHLASHSLCLFHLILSKGLLVRLSIRHERVLLHSARHRSTRHLHDFHLSLFRRCYDALMSCLIVARFLSTFLIWATRSAQLMFASSLWTHLAEFNVSLTSLCLRLLLHIARASILIEIKSLLTAHFSIGSASLCWQGLSVALEFFIWDGVVTVFYTSRTFFSLATTSEVQTIWVKCIFIIILSNSGHWVGLDQHVVLSFIDASHKLHRCVDIWCLHLPCM